MIPLPDGFFTTPITTMVEAKAWIQSLANAGMDFHFDDSPETVCRGMTGGMLFSVEQAALVTARLGEIYGFDFGDDCPIGYLIQVVDARDAPEK